MRIEDDYQSIETIGRTIRKTIGKTIGKTTRTTVPYRL